MVTYLQLLGVPKVHLEAESIPFVSDKRFLLLAYLAYRGDWVGRDQLAFLFWPDSAPTDARKNLRHLLSRARSLEFAGLESNDEQLRWQVPTDVAQFQQALGQGDWEKAIGLYKGRLLEGLEPELPDYEDWLSQEQESLHNAYREAALNHCKALEAQERPLEAHLLLSKVLKADALAEDILQGYLRTAPQAQRGEALKAYESFKTLLRQELGLEPLEATRQLAEALRKPAAPAQNPLHPIAETVAVSLEEAPKLRNLPAQLTPFVGRDVDLSEIGGFLGEPEIRLLTLTGPGGIGKTRLAVQVAQEQAAHFRDGAAFVPLAGVASGDNLAPAIAIALGLSFSPNQSPQDQLKAHLGDQNLLLVLDNLEHLLEGSGLISELLEAAPGLKVLTTSREALDFYGEYLVEVSGMDTPTDPADPHLEVYDAVQLFVRSARRVNPRFSLDSTSKPQVAQVCRMLHGSPLAIELATTWTRLLSVEEVGQEIQKSLDFLQVNQPDLPERHRSLRAVFEHSWKLLGPEEQTALMCLSVFRGGFRKEAAEAVGGVALRTLLTLTNKSLLQRTQGGRFERHPLVREFSEEKLAQSQSLYAEQQQNHGLYFFDFLQARPMGGPHDPQYLQEIEEDLENLRAAWGWAVEHKRADQLERSADLVVFYDRRARLEEGAKLFRAAIEALNEDAASHPAALGKACVDSAWLYLRLGRVERAQKYTEQAVELLRPLRSPTLMKALNILGAIRKDTGDQEQARRYFGEALELAREQGNLRAQSNYLNNLATLEQDAAFYERAKQLYEEALTLQQQNKNPFETAMLLNNLGRLALTSLDLEEAFDYLQQANLISKEIGFQVIVPYILSSLGGVALKTRDFDRAREFCFEALQTIQDKPNSTVKATVLMTLGRTATATGNLTEAARYFRESLEIVWPIRELPIVMENLVGLAELNFKLGNMDTTLELLNLVIAHPATEPWFKRDAETLLEQIPLSYKTAELPNQEALAGALEKAVTAVFYEVL